MTNFNPPGYMPGGIRVGVPSLVYGFPNGQRLPPTRPHLAMTHNGIVQGVHHNINATPYVQNMIIQNTMINNPRNIPMQMRVLQNQPPKVPSIVRLLSFAEFLGCDNPQRRDDIQFWRNITQNYFTEDVIMNYTILNRENNNKRKFELKYQVIPRFYQTFYESGIEKIQLILGNPKEFPSRVDCTSASIVYHFENGVQVAASGRLTVIFNNLQKMTSFDFETLKFTEYVPRNQQISDEIIVNEYGIPHKTMRCLEVAEAVDDMQEVMNIAIQHPHIGPQQAFFTASSQPANFTPTISNNPNPNQGIQNPQPNGKDIKHESSNYNGAPPTPNTNDLQTSAPAPTANPTPNPTPTPTPTLTPSSLVSNPNGIIIGSPHQKLQKSLSLNENLKRGNDNGPALNKKRRSLHNKTSPKKNA